MSDEHDLASHDVDDPLDDPIQDDPADNGDGDGIGDTIDGAIDGAIEDVEAAIADARQRLAGVPVETVVTNHVMGLYELAAIHLSSAPPNLPAASLAIDAVACLVDGLGDRLGPDATTLRDALANIRIAFVSVSTR